MSTKLFLCILTVHAVAVIFGVILVFVGKKTCNNQACKNISFVIKGLMNTTVDPCDDFFKYSCGKVAEKGYESVYADFVGATTEQQKQNLIGLLDKGSYNKEPRFFTLGKKFFKICQQQESSKTKLDKVIKLFKDIGGFPTLEGEKTKESMWSWLETARKLRETGLYADSVIELNTMVNPYNTSNIILMVTPPQVTLLSDQCDKSCKEAYVSQFVNATVQIGAKPEQAEKDASEILALEQKFFVAKQNAFLVDLSSAVDPSKLKNRTKTLGDVASSFSFIDWNSFVRIMVRRKSHVTNETLVIMLTPEYIKGLEPILLNIANRTITNYMMWWALKELSYKPSSEFKKDQCYKYMKSNLPLILNSMFVKQSQCERYVQYINNMVEKIRKALLDSVKNQEWMSDQTKQAAISKVKNIKATIGYLKEFRNYTLVDQYLEQLSITEDLLQSMLNIRRHSYDVKFSCQSEFINRNALCKLNLYAGSYIFEPNAAYSLVENNMIILDGIVHYPLFDLAWPYYANFGRIGSVVGHEFTHSLDTQGSHYDKDGEANNWWDTDSFKKFTRKTECFIEQYSRIKYFNGTGMQNLPGNDQVGENVADAGGLKLSFEAYTNSVKNRVIPELLLPNLDFTPEQIFFINYAQFYCGKDKEGDYIKIFLDVHAPRPIRVNVTLQNTCYFSEAFGCKLGSNMNPRKRCEIW